MQNELKPCPFCGGRKFHQNTKAKGYFIKKAAARAGKDTSNHLTRCTKCGAKGPLKHSEAEAITAWNTRVDAHPPTTNPVVVSETPVGDHQMVDAVARAIMMARDDGGCIVKDWQKEAKDNCHVAQALRQAQAALTAARAQVDGENQRLREALEITAQALLEVEGAQKRGSTWYTNGASGLYQHVAMWVTRGKVAARQALAAGEHRKDAP